MRKADSKGSVEWFENSRRRCVDHLRALLSVRMAQSSAIAILQQWERQSAETNSALHSSCVIAYARPFVNAATKSGKITYPAKRLMAAPGFDKELHAHILDLRNRMIAHSDYGIFPSSMYLQTIGDERLPIRLGINVKGIFGIASHVLALRYEKHLSICAAALEKLLNIECNDLTSEARLHPLEFQKTHNIPESNQQLAVGAEIQDLPPPTGPAAGVETPTFSNGLSEYRYITLTHQISLVEDGKHVVTEAGVAKEIFFSSD
jgi:hypothetical protein